MYTNSILTVKLFNVLRYARMELCHGACHERQQGTDYQGSHLVFRRCGIRLALHHRSGLAIRAGRAVTVWPRPFIKHNAADSYAHTGGCSRISNAGKVHAFLVYFAPRIGQLNQTILYCRLSVMVSILLSTDGLP